MAVLADGSYGIDQEVIFSYPVRCVNGDYEIVQGLDFPDSSKERAQTSLEELLEEGETAKEIIASQN